MEYTSEERGKRIISACMAETSCDPAEIFEHLAGQDFIRMHGPEHHMLDGACLLTAFANAGGGIDLEASLNQIITEGQQMPGAVCGLWGVCGAVTSIGAALAVIDKTGPLSTDDSWGSHMQYTSAALNGLSQVGGPRCCKRDAYIAMQTAVIYMNKRYPVQLAFHEIHCAFYPQNTQCLGEKCPFHPKESEEGHA